jgi:hypothetical protein
MDLHSILQAYGLDDEEAQWFPYGSGLIHKTWRVQTATGCFILQHINQHVFPQPLYIAENIRMLSGYLQQYHPDYYFISPVQTITGAEGLQVNGVGFYRMFPFATDAVSFETVKTADQAFEAASQFGRFTRLLAGFEASSLHITIPDFHDLALRYGQFDRALQQGDPLRIKAAAITIDKAKRHKPVVHTYNAMIPRSVMCYLINKVKVFV